MSLMKCSQCGNNVSEYADKCPKCGAPREKFIPVSDINYTENYAKHPQKNNSTWLWIILGLIVSTAIAGTGIYLFRNNAAEPINQSVALNDSPDSIDTAAAETTQRQAAMQDSIDKAEFRKQLATLSDIIVLEKPLYGDSTDKKYPYFRSNPGKRLKNKGYTLASTRSVKREVEGGMYSGKIQVWEKRWDRDDTHLWSKVTIDDGP